MRRVPLARILISCTQMTTKRTGPTPRTLLFHGLVLWIFLAIPALWLTPAAAQTVPTQEFHPHRILIRPKPGIPPTLLQELHQLERVHPIRTLPASGGVQVIHLPEGRGVVDLINRYLASGLVDYAEPDYRLHLNINPNDPKFTDGTQWHLHNTGQSGGTPDADIDAPEGWDTQRHAPSVIVAVVDSGVRYTHEDLAANLWVNPKEIAGNGVDDDGNGYVDDVHGINAVAGNGNPIDALGHGTMVAGLIGAAGNNSKGVTGVAWSVQIMALRFFGDDGSGYVSDAVECIDYARLHGAHIINASFSSPQNAVTLRNAIGRCRTAGIIFVAAAGNDGKNIDSSPSYPASYSHDNIVAVAATTRTDSLASYSNYGATSVHLAAPGSSIYTTAHGSNSAYATSNGTSLSAPIVSGAFALLKARFPNETYLQLIDRMLSMVDPLPSLQGKCTTGGRLNLAAALGPPDGPSMTVTPSIGFESSGLESGPFSPASKTYVASNPGNATFQWQVSHTQDWLALQPSNGSLAPGQSVEIIVRITDTAATLTPGTYTDTISMVNLDNSIGNTTRPVTLVVSPAGAITVTPTEGFTSSGIEGGPFAPANVTYTIANSGGSSIDWIAAASHDWIAIHPTSGTLTPGAAVAVSLSLTETAETLAAGTHTDTVTFLNITNSKGNTSRSINLHVDPAPGVLTLSTVEAFASAGFVSGPFNPQTRQYSLANNGGSSVTWDAIKQANWFEVTPASGTLAPGENTAVTVALSAEANTLLPGLYEDLLVFQNETSGNTPSPLTIRLSVYRHAVLSISGLQPHPFSIELTLQGEPGQRYAIQSSPNLEAWTAIHEETLDSSGLLQHQIEAPEPTAPLAFRALHLP
jgi:subtilisin family serine protease